MLNYSKITSIINFHRTAKVKLAEYLQIGESTLRDRLKKENLTPDDVAGIAEYFNKPMTYFFDKDDNQANEKGEDYTIKKIDCLECIAKQKKLDQMEKERDEFRDKYIECLEDLAGKKKAVS